MKRAIAMVLVLFAVGAAVGQVLQPAQPRRFRGPITVDGQVTMSGPAGVDGGLVVQNLTASTASFGTSFTAGAAFAGSVGTGALVATSGAFDGGVATLDLTATRNVSLPGMSASPDGGYSFAAPPAGVTTTVCATVSSAISLSTLNTATTVTTISSRYFTTATPCFVVPPANLSANVDYSCRVATAGVATIYAKAGLVGLSASSGQWCAVVVGG